MCESQLLTTAWRGVQEMSESEEERMGPGVIIRRSGKPIGQYWFKIADMDIFKPGKPTAVARTQTGAALPPNASSLRRVQSTPAMTHRPLHHLQGPESQLQPLQVTCTQAVKLQLVLQAAFKHTHLPARLQNTDYDMLSAALSLQAAT